MKRVYLDHNATTAVEPEVLEAMLPYFSQEYGNAASIHTAGQNARAAVEKAREQVALLLGARPEEVVFTSGGTESDNQAIWGAVGAAASDRACHIITTTIEHEAVLDACKALEQQGVAVTYLAVSPVGIVDPEAVRRAIQPETVLVSVMTANNELGTVQPIREISRAASERNICFHTDAVQAAGKIPLDVKALRVDLLSISGHKLYGPKGIGATYIRSGTCLRPLLYGGHHQRGYRPGTENVPGSVGLGKAAELARKSLERDRARVEALRDRLEQGLLACVPAARVNGAGAPRTPNTSNLTFAGLEGEALVIALDLKGLACSTGAACSSGAVEPSHVLRAMGLSVEEARASIRLSLGRHTTEEDVTAALEIVPAAVEQLRKLSPTWQQGTGR